MKKYKMSKKDNKKLFAFLATFLSIIGFVIAIIANRKDKYVMYYAKQSLVIFIFAVIAGAITRVFVWIPIIGWLISFAINVLIIIAWIMSWLNALSGMKKEIPLISDFADKIKL